MKGVVAVIVVGLGLCSARCKEERKPGELAFTRKMNVMDFAQRYSYKKIDCCATGYERIVWYHKQRGNATEEKYPFSWSNKTDLKDSNRTIVITDLPLEASGTFWCAAINTTSKKCITHELRFSVNDNAGKRVIPLKPPENLCINDTTLVVTCSADFGKFDKFDVSIGWYYSLKEYSIENEPSFSEYGNMILSQRKVKRYKDTVYEAILTLRDVSSRNNGTVLRCHISSTQNGGEHTVHDTTLTMCEVTVIPVHDVLVLPIAVGVAGFIVLLIVVVSLTCFCCRRHIREKWPSIYYKLFGGVDPMLGENKYHALIQHDDECTEDRNLALDLYKDMTAMGYQLCIPKLHSEAGPTFTGIGDLAEKSATFIIIVPSSFTMSDQQGSDNTHRNFSRQTSSILEIFEDHKSMVTVIYRNKPPKKPQEFLGFKDIVLYNKKTVQWRKCLQKLQMRMPIPMSKHILDTEEQSHDHYLSTKNMKEIQPLMKTKGDTNVPL